jgi:TPR repeat protein
MAQRVLDSLALESVGSPEECGVGFMDISEALDDSGLLTNIEKREDDIILLRCNLVLDAVHNAGENVEGLQRRIRAAELAHREAVEQAYRKAAEQGDVIAQYNLGLCYGKVENVGEAMKWYRKVTEQGSAIAQYNLGLCYDEIENVGKAMKWYRKAQRSAATVLRIVRDKVGDGEAMKWYRKAAEQGHAEAQKQLKNSDGGLVLFLTAVTLLIFCWYTVAVVFR